MDILEVKVIYEKIIRFLLRCFLFLIPFLTVLSFNISNTYAYNSADAQGVAITVFTDKREYLEGDTLVISGAIRSPAAKTPLTLQIFDSEKNLVHIAQTDLAQDGTYTIAVKIGGSLWKNYGTYIIRVQYGFHHVATQTTFDLIELSEPSKQTFHIDTGSQGSYDIPYTISGGTVNNMKIDFASLTLDLSINATKDGSIQLDIPRHFMDAKKMDGSDEKFIILINGTEIYTTLEQDSTTSRNVTINFLRDDSKIQLVGTQIVPEFGPISSFVLLISIISIIIMANTLRIVNMSK